MKSIQPIKIQLSTTGSSPSPISLLPSSCSVCHSAQGTAQFAELGCKGIYCIFLMMRTQAGLSAKVVLSSIPILFHSIAILFYLNKHFTGMPSSVCFLFITLTFRFFWVRLACLYCFLETLMMAEQDVKRTESAIRTVVPCFERCMGKAGADMLLSVTQSDVFADQPHSHAHVVTAQV